MKSIYFWILIHRLWTLYNQFYKITYSARSVQYSTKTIFILSTSIYDLVLICICLSLSSSSSSGDISIKSWTIEILVLTSWITASMNFFQEIYVINYQINSFYSLQISETYSWRNVAKMAGTSLQNSFQDPPYVVLIGDVGTGNAIANWLIIINAFT